MSSTATKTKTKTIDSAAAVEREATQAATAAAEARQAVADALAAVQGAEAARDATHERIRRGEDVTAAELTEAEMGLELAKIRHGLAIDRAHDADEAARVARIGALRATLPARLASDQVDAAYAELERAARAFMAACRAYDEAHDAATTELGALGELPPEVVLEGTGRLYADGVTYRRQDVQLKAMQALRDAFEATHPRMPHSFNPR